MSLFTTMSIRIVRELHKEIRGLTEERDALKEELEKFRSKKATPVHRGVVHSRDCSVFCSFDDFKNANSTSCRECSNCRLWCRRGDTTRGFCLYQSMAHQIITGDNDTCDHHKYAGEM